MSLKTAIRDLVIANRILGNEGVVDAFGHISIRHPERPDRYFLSRSRSPMLVTEDDILEFDLDSNALDQRGRVVYAERFIHGAIYKDRSDLMSVCHSHARPLIPFSVTGTAIRPVWIVTGSMGSEVPIWDIRDDFPDGGEMMVIHDAAAQSLSRAMGKGNACLMRGHGAVIATADVKQTVSTSISLMLNAETLMGAQVLTLASGRRIKYMTDAEVEASGVTMAKPLGLNRAWEYWALRAGMKTDINR
jgi:HCOMODA/2-hydroxy-3-carboxy-muconic semialdehyde decarboxylase